MTMREDALAKCKTHTSQKQKTKKKMKKLPKHPQHKNDLS